MGNWRGPIWSIGWSCQALFRRSAKEFCRFPNQKAVAAGSICWRKTYVSPWEWKPRDHKLLVPFFNVNIPWVFSPDLSMQMGFPLDISLYRAPWWVGSTVSKLNKNPYGYKKPQNPSPPPQLNHLYAESDSDSDNDSDQTLFPKFIVLELTEDTPITKLPPFIIEKSLSSLMKPKSKKNQSTISCWLKYQRKLSWISN